MSDVQVHRTLDERFAGLPDWPWESHHHEIGGVRMAYVDEGQGRPVLLLHGEPTWGYLWRKVMPPLLEAGHRVIVPDHIGFGRSDKPTAMEWYSWDGHCAALHSLVEALDLHDVTLVCHDWGGPIGLRVCTEAPERFPRIVMMDTGMWTGKQRMSDNWLAFRDFVERTEDLPIGVLVKGACKHELPDDVYAAYEAPFPTPESKAGARAFPLMIPFDEDLPDAVKGRAAMDHLAMDGRPKLILWADSDPVLPVKQGQAVAQRINAPEPEIIADAGHFLQEDQGELIGRRIAQWLADQGV